MAQETQASQDFSELEVPGEAGLYWCWRHRKVQTRLRCGRCEKPICPKCTRMGPTGARCVECASNRTQHIYKVGIGHLLLTFLATAIFSVIAVPIIQRTGLFLLFFAPIIGTVLGKGIIAVTRGKRGPILAWAATIGAILGVLVGIVPDAWLLIRLAGEQIEASSGAYTMDYRTALLTDIGYSLIYLAIIIPALWYWIK
jgi:hypothetical protein